ncbi:MAG: hypothetical protein QHH24_03295 [Candidatus Bathyarchaeota archaeon]|nr:hypothetical protein [Candidatus Bathyarchaeota archaeon]
MSKTKMSMGKKASKALPKVLGTRPETKPKLHHLISTEKVKFTILNSEREQLKEKILRRTESPSMVAGFQFRKAPLLMEVR